uniref:YqgF domain-containing protein n=1 Tax=Gongylonema pulchrum TaxID=637853 RepID=A0A183ESM6_9BILA
LLIFRYIRDKPVAQLRHDEFLWYAQAKSAGLLNVKLHCDTEEEVRFKRTLLQEFLTDQPYYKDEYSRVVDLWNKAREEAVIVCVNSFILPVLEREAHGRLLQESRDYVIKAGSLNPISRCFLRNVPSQSTQNLYDRIRMAAYRSPHEYGDDSENGFTGGTRVLSIAYPEERGQASFCALLDQDGQVLDHLRLVNITKGLNSRRPGEADLKRQDLNSLRKFIEKRRPHVIAISGENMEAIYLHRDISS